jgi:hypothetical protein
MEGVSPLLSRTDIVDGTAVSKLTKTPPGLNATTKISTFTWASPSSTPIGLVLNQEYQVFASAFYYLPAPADWSFVKGSPDPFA